MCSLFCLPAPGGRAGGRDSTAANARKIGEKRFKEKFEDRITTRMCGLRSRLDATSHPERISYFVHFGAMPST